MQSSRLPLKSHRASKSTADLQLTGLNLRSSLIAKNNKEKAQVEGKVRASRATFLNPGLHKNSNKNENQGGQGSFGGSFENFKNDLDNVVNERGGANNNSKNRRPQAVKFLANTTSIMDMTPSPIPQFGDPFLQMSSLDELNSSDPKQQQSRAAGNNRMVDFSFNNNIEPIALRNSNVADPFDLVTFPSFTHHHERKYSNSFNVKRESRTSFACTTNNIQHPLDDTDSVNYRSRPTPGFITQQQSQQSTVNIQSISIPLPRVIHNRYNVPQQVDKPQSGQSSLPTPHISFAKSINMSKDGAKPLKTQTNLAIKRISKNSKDQFSSAAIMEKSIRAEQITDIDFNSESIDSSFEEKEVDKQARLTRMKKAEEMEELLLQKACLMLMGETKDMNEAVKRVQFNKFYPERYQEKAYQLKGMGTLIDRNPPADVKESSTNLAQSKQSIAIGEKCTSQVIKTSNDALMTAEKYKKETSSKQKQKFKLITKSPLRGQSASRQRRTQYHKNSKNRSTALESHQRASSHPHLNQSLATPRSHHNTKRISSLVREASNTTAQPASILRRGSLVRFEDTLMGSSQIKYSKRQRIHNAMNEISQSQLFNESQQQQLQGNSILKAIKFELSKTVDKHVKPRSLKQSFNQSQLLVNGGTGQSGENFQFLSAMSDLNEIVKNEIKAKFSKVEGASLNLFGKSSRSFEKKRLIEYFENHYRENRGSQLLAKGVIEHIFFTRKNIVQSRKKQDKLEEISIEDFWHYLTEYLLTNDRQRQLETAFTLYLYISRHKIFHNTPPTASSNYPTGQTEGNMTNYQDQSSIVISTKLASAAQKSRKQRDLFTIRENDQADTMTPGLPQNKSSLMMKSSRQVQKLQSQTVLDHGSPLSSQGSQKSRGAFRQKLSATRKAAALQSPERDNESIPFNDFVSTGTAMMKQVQSDQIMTDVDLFNIIGNSAISFLPHDTRVLANLMNRFGTDASQQVNPQHSSESLQQNQGGQQQTADGNPDLTQIGLGGTNGGGPASPSDGTSHQGAMSSMTSAKGRKSTANPTGFSAQLNWDRQHAREAKQLKALEKKVCSTYNRSFMPSKSKADLRKSIQAMKINRTECEQVKEQLTGKKTVHLDEDLLGPNFTPYKLRLIEQSNRMKNNADFLDNILRKPGVRHRNNKSTAPVTEQNLSQAIQNKAVLKKYRNLHSACSLYTLVNQNPEPFMKSEYDSSEDEGAEKRQARDKLLKKVSCPLKYKIQQKVYREKSKSQNKNVVVKRPFLKLIKIPTNFQNPWERTASIAPDGTFKFKQGLERLLLTKNEQEKFIETVRINTRLKEFRAKAYYDKEGASRKLLNCLSMQDFKTNAYYQVTEGIPEVIVVAIYLIYGHKVLNFYLKTILKSKEVCKIEEWPKIMEKDKDYYNFCHKQIKIRHRRNDNLSTDTNNPTGVGEYQINATGGIFDENQLIQRTVIRRNLDMPVVMSTFRRNALQSTDFFHNYMNQSVSYNKVTIDKEVSENQNKFNSSGMLRDQEALVDVNRTFELEAMFLEKVKPLFSQLCDPYTSYNQGVYGITLKQLTSQSELLFGNIAPYFGERVFSYLIVTQRRTMIALQGGENRFKRIKTPHDYIEYQSWLDFCFNCCRPEISTPFDKRKIEVEMLDRNNLFSIDIKDVLRLERGVEQFVKEDIQKQSRRGEQQPDYSSTGSNKQSKTNDYEFLRRRKTMVKAFQVQELVELEESNTLQLRVRKTIEATMEGAKLVSHVFQSKSESEESDDLSVVDAKKKNSITTEKEYYEKARFNHFLNHIKPPSARILDRLVRRLKEVLERKQDDIDAVRQKNIQKQKQSEEAQQLQELNHAQHKKQLQFLAAKTTGQVGDIKSLQMIVGGESQPVREIAKIFSNEYSKIIDMEFGEKETPILDVIAYHILMITEKNNPIKYNEDNQQQ